MTTALITNDDGIDSPGLVALAAAAHQEGLDVLVAAPSWDSSGASASLTGVRDDGRLVVEDRELRGVDGPTFAVDASPALISLTALRGGFGPIPDIVLSGVNRGRNTGHAVLHSGTVGAALTAANDGVCGLAVSIDAADPRHWTTAIVHARHVLRWVLAHRPTVVINLNVPDLAAEEVRGLRTAPLARVGAVQTNVTDVREGYIQLTFDELETRPEVGTDAALLAEGWAVVSAIDPLDTAAVERLDGIEPVELPI